MKYHYIIRKSKKGLVMLKCLEASQTEMEAVDIIKLNDTASFRVGEKFVPSKKWNLIGYGEHDTIEKIFTKPKEEWLG